MTDLRLGGVPEHFNLPVHQAIERDEFANENINVIWNDCPGGTGQMTKALREGELDVCILLTEGIIADIINGNPSKLISVYVKTPLCWGIHTGFENSLTHLDDIFDKRYAISRLGSGSHLMPLVHAHAQNKKLDDKQFVIVNKLHQAIESLSAIETDVFYWEKYTTKPFVQKGTLRRVGEFYSPWPCFVIAATDKAIHDSPDVLKKFLKILQKSNARFMASEDTPQMVADRYDLDYNDAFKWFHATEWSTDSWVSNKMIDSTMSNLIIADIISNKVNISELVWIRNEKLRSK